MNTCRTRASKESEAVPRRTSDIPKEAEERLMSEYRQEGPLTYLRIKECLFHEQIVGRRAYDNNGNLLIETPLKNSKKHGREYSWNEGGALELIEPYFEGKLHGLARQYGHNGKIIGTYRFLHGTGLDIWRQEREDGSIFISEIHSLRDGLPDGYEWWLRVDQRSLWHELHWKQGVLHGIERMWKDDGSLRRGYPKFWTQGQHVSRRTYIKASQQDQTLPISRVAEDRPERQFPPEIENLITV